MKIVITKDPGACPPGSSFEWFAFPNHMAYSPAQAKTYTLSVPILSVYNPKLTTCYLLLKGSDLALEGLNIQARQQGNYVDIFVSWYATAWEMGVSFVSL